MAGAGYKLFNTGDVLTAAQVNTYLQEQAVMRFANAAARTTALSGVLAEGMVSYLMDTDAVEVYNGSAWVSTASGDITAVTAGTGISGGGTSGAVTITNDMATTIDAKGDLIAGTGADAYARLAVGTDGQVLTADSTTATGLKWATAASGTTFAGCSASSGVDLTLSNNTWTAVTWNTERFDSDGYHSTSTNTSRMTIPAGKAGKYLVTGNVDFDDNTTGNRRLNIYKNGVSYLTTYTPPSAIFPSANIVAVMDLAVGDYVELYAKQDSGSSQSLYISSITGDFSIAYLGA